ncbi:hypothetical protein [Frondihabitans australicus]|uniref:Uncharacterized protein n=1 Tax=Frondihabitans australicus TaxID=386892 RepID=A0A495IDT8_9MICO|nr:hypothetical protein [Frondihabitans australicus]RKR74167.1 hypothetical protein C8E83_1275 [Frondihabitans australicus]
MNATPAPDYIDPVRRAAVRRLVHDQAQEHAAAAPAIRRRRVLRFTAIAASAVVVLGGGGLAYAALGGGASTQGPVAVPVPVTSAPAPSTVPSAGPSKTSAPGPTSEPAGTATPLPVDPSSWTITTAGIGPIALGGSQTAAAAAAASAYSVARQAYACPVDFYTPHGGGDPKLTTQAFSGDRIDLIMIGALGTSPAADSPKTPSGIGLGSTQAALLATYPDIESLSTTVGTTSTFGETYGIEDSSGRWLTFVLDEHGVVGEIDVTYTKGKPGEFC